MKRIILLIGVGVLMVSLIACEFAGITVDLGGGSADTGGSAAVEAGIDSPADGAALQMSPVQVSYHASSTGGISMVELSVNGEVVSSVASPDSDQQVVALKYTWTPSAPGSHTLRVRAQGSGGNWSDYSAITVTIEGQEEAPPAEQPEPEPEEEQAPPQEEEEEEEGPPDTDKITIYDVKRDTDTLYYGSGGCDNEITISAKVTRPEDVRALVLFIRFVDKEGEGTTKWDDGHSMSKKSEGSYSITLSSEKIPNYSLFEFAKMHYQIVVQDKAGNYNPRTDVFTDLDYQVCQ